MSIQRSIYRLPHDGTRPRDVLYEGVVILGHDVGGAEADLIALLLTELLSSGLNTALPTVRVVVTRALGANRIGVN